MDEREEPRAAPEPRLVAGRFELGAELERSPCGRVFGARDLRNQGRALALLFLDPELAASEGALARLEQHVERVRALGHPAIVLLRNVGRDARHGPWLASDLVEGESLRALLDRKGALPPRQALEIARQVLSALEAGHARGLVHGAIAAENVRLADRSPWSEENPFGVGVRLPGFGLAALLGKGAASSEGDLLATALLLAELATGTRPLPDAREWGRDGAGSCLPGEVRSLLDRALSAEPGGRFPGAREFRAAIERSRAWRPARRRRVQALGAAALALALFLLLARERVQRRALARELAETRALVLAADLAGGEARALCERLLDVTSPFPGPEGAVRLYRERGGAGEQGWLLETVREGPADPARPLWHVEQQTFDAGGIETQALWLAIERQGERFVAQDEGRTLLDLSGAGAQVRTFELEPPGAVPERLGIAQEDVERFQAALAGAARRALVVEQADGSESWLSAELGLVRHVTPGRAVRELAYAEIR